MIGFYVELSNRMENGKVFRFPFSVFRLSNDDLLSLVIESQHIHTGSGIQFDAADTVDLLGDDDAAHHVDDLEGALTVDDDVAVAHEGKVAAVAGVAGGEHQAEAAGVVVGVGFEAVTRVGQQVNIGAGQVVDEVQVI